MDGTQVDLDDVAVGRRCAIACKWGNVKNLFFLR